MADLRGCVFETEMGWVGLAATSAGLNRVTLPYPTADAARQELGLSTGTIFSDDDELAITINRFCEYFSGRRVDFNERLDLREATPFQRIVWETARHIPYGEVRSYGQLAHDIGAPRAARAVGNALGRNPLPIIIPCHRVLSISGRLGGFRGGLALKRRLLALEGVAVSRYCGS